MSPQKLFLGFTKKLQTKLMFCCLGVLLLRGCTVPSLDNLSSELLVQKTHKISTSVRYLSDSTSYLLETSMSFTEWCQNRENLSPEKQHTIEVLLRQVRINDNNCANAEEKLFDENYLYLDSYDLEDITPLASLKNLKTLNLSSNKIKDITPLATLTQLKYLGLENNKIEDITLLKKLTNLETLKLSSNRVKDIASLATLKNLRLLILSNNQLEDITALSSLINLQYLYLSFNRIKDLDILENLIALESLNVSFNPIQDILPLTTLNQIKSLYIASTDLKDVTKIATLTTLKILDLSSNQIADISSLTSLKSLSTLDLSSNQIEDISSLTSLNSLSTLDLSYNQIENVSPLTFLVSQTERSVWLNLSFNQIQDATPLASLTDSVWLNLIENPLLSQKPSMFEETEFEKTAIFSDAPLPPPLPAKLPRPLYHPELHRQTGIHYLKDSAYRVLTIDSFGVGHLIPRPTKNRNLINNLSGRPFSYGGWLGDVVLPLYQQPEGTLRGWIARGRLLKTTLSEETPFIVDERPFALLQGGYKGSYPSFVVLEIRPDGWFRFRYTHPTEEDDGTAWAHQSHLRLGAFHLALQTWEEFLSEYQGFFLYFRDEKPHALHILPNENSRVLTQTTNNGENKIEFLEFQGEWAKINLKFYKPYICQTDSKVVAEYQGWVRWRSSELGSLMWYAGAGC